jgi:Smg protein
MDSTVFDILVYVFDRYMLEELPESSERESISRDLQSVGFGEANVERALDWLADLAEGRDRPAFPSHGAGFRLYSGEELLRLDAACRGLLLTLERGGILTSEQREIVIERLLALESDEINLEQARWVVLMVLSSQPGKEAECARLGDLAQVQPVSVPH